MVAIALIKNWKVVGGLIAALLVLFLWGPWRGDDAGDAQPQTQVVSEIPTLTSPPPTARIEPPPITVGQDPIPTTGPDGTLDITRDDRCRWLLAPDDYLVDLESLATEVSDLNQLWDNRELRYSEMVERMEQWLESVRVRLGKYPPTAEGGMDAIREWAAEMEGGAEDILHWLRSSASGSANNRRFAVTRFGSLVREVPYLIVGC